MATRPGIGERPGVGERPGIADRPGIGERPGMGERPGVGNRPGISDRPGIADRPGIGNRPGIDNRPGIADRPDIGNRPIIGSGNNINVSNRPNYHGDWHHGDWHDHWDHHWNWHPYGWGWGAGFVTGVTAASPWMWGYWPYYNPYWDQPAASTTYINYSQPIVAATPPASPTQAPTQAAAQPTAQDEALGQFDSARADFKEGDYKAALIRVDRAIQKLPNDAVLHEFRGLCLFALGQYRTAAAALYAVLSAGPGWDWTTLSGLYPSVDVYTQQLRTLETYCREHPDASDARFVLAYHYLTTGSTDAAAAQLKKIVAENPKDELSAQLLKSMSGSDTEPPPTEPAAPPQPVSAAALAGDWQASRPDGSSFALNLSQNNRYDWKFTKQGKTQDFSGTYTLADNVLILKQNEQPTMVGQVTLLASNQFNFKLAGANPADPGLTFSR